MARSFFAFCLLMSVLCLVVASPASAGCYGCYACSYTDSADSPPYFAVHPPVYYSYPVYRTYGVYPFPYYAEPMQSAAIPVEPKTLINPYVEQNPNMETQYAKRKPLRILNPYVEQSGSDSNSSQEASDGIKPKVIYPTKITSKG
jgi:hypothetical protein